MTEHSVDGVDLDDIDQRMIAELQADGRLSINELAKRVNIARATAYARLDRLTEAGVITGFHAAVSPAAMGRSLAALVMADVDQGAWSRLVPQLSALPGVDYVALTAGDFDIAIMIRVKDVSALREMLLVHIQSLPEVRSTKTAFILDEVVDALGSARSLG